MNVLDSSAWLAMLVDGPNAETFAAILEKPEELVVPVITLYEVFKKVLRERGETIALGTVANMHQGRVVNLDGPTALHAARLSAEHSLPMADALILATAREHRAVLWTQDADFAGIDGVRYLSA